MRTKIEETDLALRGEGCPGTGVLWRGRAGDRKGVVCRETRNVVSGSNLKFGDGHFIVAAPVQRADVGDVPI
jgi:hypothetical protein